MPIFLKPSFIIESDIDGDAVLRRLEICGRVCYKSEEKTTADSASRFVKGLIKNGHESVLEHVSISVRIICDRGVTHEIVRHRIASFSQESTRYCNYGDIGVQFIEPFFFVDNPERLAVWTKAVYACEGAYLSLLSLGASPQEARSVLPNSTKTEIIMTCNLREWRHFFRMRTSKKAHPQMREIAVPLLEEFQKRFPIVFEDIIVQ